MSGKASLRVWAQIGDSPLLYELGSGEVANHAEVAQRLRDIADGYEESVQNGQRPALGLLR